MKYKLLGNSGLKVSELCLGTMTFGKDWGWGATKQESKAMFDAFIERGGNFIDTANRYTDGTSEKFTGEFISDIREKVVVATKYTLSMDPSNVNAGGNNRKTMIQSVEASLKRLDTDYIDLYWVHAWDFLTPEEEVMRALDDLIRAGKVLYIGISDTPAWTVAKANTLAELKGWTQFVGLQIEYNLAERTVERELMPMAGAYNMSVLAWSPLSRGLLSGKYNSADFKFEESRLKEGSSHLNKRNLKIADTVIKIASDMGRGASEVALRWLLQKNNSVIPIIGTRKSSQLKENFGCLDFELSKRQMEKLDKVSEVDLGFPHEFLKTDNVRNLIHGEHEVTK